MTNFIFNGPLKRHFSDPFLLVFEVLQFFEDSDSASKASREDKRKDSHADQQTRGSGRDGDRAKRNERDEGRQERSDGALRSSKPASRHGDGSSGRKEKETASTDKRPASGRRGSDLGTDSSESSTEKPGKSTRSKEGSDRLRNKVTSMSMK